MTYEYPPCDRCGHPERKHRRHVPTSRSACNEYMGTDHNDKPVLCPCDGYFPKRGDHS